MVVTADAVLQPLDRAPDGGITVTIADLRLANTDRAELLRGLSLEIPPGATMGLVGESGSGKSLICKAIMGMMPRGVAPTAGSVVLSAGEPVPQQGTGQCAAMIYQNHHDALNPTMRAGRALVTTIRAHHRVTRRQAKEQAVALLSSVGFRTPLRHFDDYPHQLSGGMRQRLGIALALACQPRILIADEPTTALDAIVQRDVLSLLRGVVKANGMSLLMVSHDIAVIGSMCDTIGVMYAGELVELGPAEQLLRRPLHPYTRALLACDPRYGRGPLRGIAGSVLPPGARARGCLFAPRCEFAEDECRSTDIRLSAAGGRSVRCRRAGEISGWDGVGDHRQS